MRLSTVFSFALLIVLGCGVYNVANKYEKTEKKLSVVQNKIGGEQEAIRVLQAEWTFLTSPDRLEKISDEYLHLQAVDGRQYVALNTIPMRAALDTAQGAAEEVEQQVASVETPKKKENAVASAKLTLADVQAKQKIVVKSEMKTAANTPAKAAAEDDAFQKILAKELAPVSQNLPAASTKPLPELSAIPVSLMEDE